MQKMNFCHNCGTKLFVEGLKFCRECRTSLQTTISSVDAAAVLSTPERESAKAFELFEGELSSKAGEVAKDVGDSTIKWKASGRYPKRFGSVMDAVTERAVPPLAQMKIRSMPWKNEGVGVTTEGKAETSVSTSFPLELQTGIPFARKSRPDGGQVDDEGDRGRRIRERESDVSLRHRPGPGSTLEVDPVFVMEQAKEAGVGAKNGWWVLAV